MNLVKKLKQFMDDKLNDNFTEEEAKKIIEFLLNNGMIYEPLEQEK